jgi:hypothetical protein
VERERDSKNFGVRIVRNGVMVGKIWTFEVLGAKWSFHVVLGGIFGTYRVYGGLGVKGQGHMQNLAIYRGLIEVLEGLRLLYN